LGPTANIAPIPYWMQDRYAYFAAPGLLLAVVECVHGLLLKWKQENPERLLGFGVVLFVATLSAVRSPLFVDAATLSIDAAERQPFSGMAQLQAWTEYKHRAQKIDPTKPEWGMPSENAYKALVCFDRATRCADLTNVKEAFEMRTRTAELVLRQLNDPELASTMLKDWLPPAHLKQRDTTKVPVAADMKYYYEPETLLHAKLIAIEAQLMLANPRKSLAEFPIQARLAACRATLVESERAQLPKNQGALLKAKILLVLSDLEENAKDLPNALKHFEEAKALLSSVPKTSRLFPETEYLLSHIVPPDLAPRGNANPAH